MRLHEPSDFENSANTRILNMGDDSARFNITKVMPVTTNHAQQSRHVINSIRY